jgi:hypothetical protein
MGYNPSFAGTVANGSSRQTQSGGFTNGTGSTIAIGTPVSTNTVGNMVLLDVTNEALVNAFIGLTSIRVPANAEGLVVNAGRLEGINLGFSVGDPVYAGITPGSLTNIKPDLTVSGWNSGDFVIFLGCYVKNQFTSGLYDIQLMPTIVGQL